MNFKEFIFDFEITLRERGLYIGWHEKPIPKKYEMCVQCKENIKLRNAEYGYTKRGVIA
jgi:hypothetical protein